MTHAAISGQIAGARTINDGSLRLSIDVPLEHRELWMLELGAPVAVARLGGTGDNPPRSSASTSSVSPSSSRHWQDRKPSQQAYLRCTQRDFQEYAGCKSEAETVAWLYLRCGIESRSELDTNQDAQEIWVQIEDEFTAQRDYGEFL